MVVRVHVHYCNIPGTCMYILTKSVKMFILILKNAFIIFKIFIYLK